MTFEEKCKQMLVDHGMFPAQAAEVFEMVRSDPANASMADRWNDHVEDYNASFVALMWMSAKEHALAWIDKNKPQAWCRPIFAE